MIHLAALILAAAAASSAAANTSPSAIGALDRRYGSGTELTSLLVSGEYAVARAKSGDKAIHAGLHRAHGKWEVACEIDAPAATATFLEQKCGFSSAAARQLADDEVANAAAQSGHFSTAAASETAALHESLPETRAEEAARLQLLNTLNQQMSIGQISRPDAIRKWNEARFSMFFP